MQFLVLGHLEALDGQRAVGLGSAKQRHLLAALLVHANQLVSVDRLADILWGEAPPGDATATIQTYVSRLRSALEPGRAPGDPATTLLTRAPGYLLSVDPDDIDASRFARAVGDGQRAASEGDAAEAVRRLDGALALWRGDAYAEFADEEFIRTEALRLEELRRVAVEERVEARLSLGLHAELIGELEGIVAAEPLRERPRAQLMLALYRSGRDAEALRAYHAYRQHLGEELGVEPSSTLQQLEHDIVQQDPVLRAAREPVSVAPESVPVPEDLTLLVAPPVAPPAAPIGRAGELDALRGWLADALGGSPRIVRLMGDAGIGKSRLATALVGEAQTSSVRLLLGRCLEGSELPMLPVASMLGSLGVDVGDADSGDSAPDEHGTRLRVVVEASRALMAAAASQPVLVVLEDAQWADPATIELFAHLSATISHEATFRQLPVMMLVTARPQGGTPGARQLLALLAQETIGRTLTLDGLDELGAFALLSSRTDARPSSGLLRLVRQATDGNPREIETLLDRLEREGALEVRAGECVTTVRDVSALLLPGSGETTPSSPVSDETKELMTYLALMRDGTIEALRLASPLEPEAFDLALDEADDAGWITDDGVRIAFVNDVVRRQLAQGGSVRRQQRVHAAIAARLASVEDPSLPLITEIAEQLIRSGPEADPAAVAEYGTRAGDRAIAMGAWDDAERYYESALESGALSDAVRARVERSAGMAAYRNGDPRAAARHAEAAVALNRGIGDLEGWGEAALLMSRAVFVTGAAREADAGPDQLEEFLAAAGDLEPALRARAHATLSEIASSHLRYDTARTHADAAERIAGEVDDPMVTARVEFVVGLERFGALELDAAERCFRRSEAHAREADDSLIEAWALGRQPLVLWTRGELDAAKEAAARALRHDREQGWWGEYALAAALQTGIAVAQGNVGVAEGLAADAARALDRGEMLGAAGLLWPAVAQGRALRGDGVGAQRALEEWDRSGALAVDRFRDLVDGLTQEATTRASDSRHLAAFSLRASEPPAHDYVAVGLAASNVELADAHDAPALAANALPVLESTYASGTRFVVGWSLFIPRLIGVAHLLSGHHDEAERWLTRAIADAEHAGALGEHARASYDLARARLLSGSPVGTTELLSDAILELERLGLRGLLGAARSLAGLPERAGGAAAEARVILITDLVDSTPLNQRLGDQKFLELLREHNRIVRGRLHRHDGVEFKHTGDGIAAWFVDAASAVRCALGIQDDLALLNASRGEPFRVRIGLAAGEVISHEGDLFGLTVVEAFRICDEARDGRVLVSDVIAERVRDSSFDLTSVGEVHLKGFAGARRLHAVTAAGV